MCPKLRHIIFFCVFLANVVNKVWLLPVPLNAFEPQEHANDEEASLKTIQSQESTDNTTDQASSQESMRSVEGNLNEIQRKQRQVVQPKWLTFPDSPFESKSADVRVTKQNLREAAALRKLIQNAVKQDKTSVKSNSSKSRSTSKPRTSSRPKTSRRPTATRNKSTNNGAQQWAQWSFKFPPPLDGNFAFGQLLSQTSEQQKQQQAFLNEMERIWQLFMQQTDKMFQQRN